MFLLIFYLLCPALTKYGELWGRTKGKTTVSLLPKIKNPKNPEKIDESYISHVSSFFFYFGDVQ